ncbi:expressed unknown protein [Seminavis robusta]|uniref:Uncharacterized protein n=1 Tax=Seminavis robusta TaxID=568900 RepID=A0A9N8HUQ1_9STRA|nr:expressed unknown protein [Seminavis robusta]|eukprot:Sro1684_g290970.1 n/a (117) ;mRNA; f:105-455
MRVGIIACSCFGLAANTLQQGLCSGDGEEEYNAQHGDVFITVGEITHVGAEHVEYNTNTALGFSGGAAVLLDNDSEYHMCVLAAHAGYSESKGTNFGFLVAKKAKQYWYGEAQQDV